MKDEKSITEKRSWRYELRNRKIIDLYRMRENYNTVFIRNENKGSKENTVSTLKKIKDIDDELFLRLLVPE